ncbi:MAG: hypothetical protein LLF94_06515 [Chlamydiales bacterium]|nr:hypothetical protein [Chlamydiales bacterium]
MSVQGNNNNARLLDDPSSQTGNSLSHNPTRPSKLRQQDVGKFVRRKDKFPVLSTILEQRISDVEAIFAKAALDLRLIEKEMQWASKSSQDMKSLKRQISAVQVRIAQDEELYGKDGIYTYVGVVVEEARLADIMQRVAKLGMTSLLLHDRAETLFAVSDSKTYPEELSRFFVNSSSLFTPHESRQFDFAVVDRYITEYVKLIDSKLVCPFDKGDEQMAAFIETLKKTAAPVKKTKTEQVKLQAVKTLMLQMLKICDADIKKSLIPNSRASLIEAVIDHCERDIMRKKGQLALPADQQVAEDRWNGEPLVRVVEDVCLTVLAQDPPLPEYVYKSHITGLGPWENAKYTWGSYDEYFNLGVALEASIGQPLGGLIVRMNTEIMDGLDGITPIVLNHFQSCIVTLEHKFDAQFAAICSKEASPLTPSLVTYAYGLAWGFNHARSLLQVAEKCQEKPALEILKAANMIGAYYRDRPSFSNLDAMINFFEPAEDMQKIVLNSFSQTEEVQPEKRDPLEAFLCKIAEYTNEVHANKDVEALKLSSVERQVPSEVLRLLDATPNKPLPINVLTYLAKKMMTQSFLPSADHDMELELVIHVLVNTYENEYTASLNAYEYLRPIYGKFIKQMDKNALKKEILDEAAAVAKLVFMSQETLWDTLSYVAAWQKLFEFERTYCGPDKQFDSRIDGLCHFLRDNLHEATRIHEYDPVLPEVASRDLETWKTDKPDEFLAQLEGKPDLFNSIVQRIVGACLFAETNEEQLAQTKLFTLLQNEAYSDLIARLSPPVKLLIAENAMKKCNSTLMSETQVLTRWEKTFLLDEPVKSFLEKPYSGFDAAIIQKTLCKIIAVEGKEGETAQMCREKWPDFFEKWFAGYEQLLAGNPYIIND